MLYLLGLSYGAVTPMLEALGLWIGKTTVDEAVQAAAECVPGMKQKKLLEGYRRRALGADLTSVKCKGQWLPIGVVVDPINGLVLSIDHLDGEDAQTLQVWIESIADHVGAHTLVTDDADAFKQAADGSGLDQQVCKSHVVRNTEALITSLGLAIETTQDASLVELQIEPVQALADLPHLGELIHSRQSELQAELQALYERYASAAPPRKGRMASIAYRMRNLFLDRWNLWPHLVGFRGPSDPGWDEQRRRAGDWLGVKERYRTTPALHRTHARRAGASVRTYKLERSVRIYLMNKQ